MLALAKHAVRENYHVSVAGCLGYDVLGLCRPLCDEESEVSVAGCLGYDVLDMGLEEDVAEEVFQLLVV
ncbi:hypothetical protein BSPWISOX_2256 [uncultured Gammaproteobacteria bacterium]|nr:hypothetical protein BSPWISOX_2256 [uncultured Gammaproteobacteria bacterium]